MPVDAPRASAKPLVHAGPRQVLADYIELTKPKVQSLLLLTTVATMYVAGDPSLALVLATCIGGYLSAGGAGAVNHYYDRDIDARMERTADRPVPAGRVSPRAALIYGVVLAALSFIWLTATVNLLAAALAFGGFLTYVFVYTVWLKRTSTQNIVIGGAAGAVPPLVGWAAVTGGLSGEAFYLFAIVFFWTPPHFWALALLMKDEYAAVGVPMLPVVKGEKETRRQILLYPILCRRAWWDLPCLINYPGRTVRGRRSRALPQGGSTVSAASLSIFSALPSAAVRGDGAR
ncbi:MAG: heme o synthase [Solirubrobacterales bacterium]|nr:heme o synthase [Solirubrobacterales bacterium]